MAEAIGTRIIGTWKLVSWTYTDDLGHSVPYFGDGAQGILMYDAHGYMNAQLMRAGRMPFAKPGFADGTPEETQQAVNSYLAYYGRYHEAAPGEIIHEVEGSLFPNWVGHRQVRYATVIDDRLTLHTLPIAVQERKIVFYITWQRL
jgi:hypothetical protein